MKLSLKALVPAAVLALGLAVSTAEAAPAGSGLTPLKGAPEATNLAEKTYWVRRCYRRHHRVHCHRVWVKPRHRHYRHYRHHRDYRPYHHRRYR